MQFLANQLGTPKTIDTQGREKVFEGAFTHFLEVLWDHHTHQPENTPFLKRYIF